MALVGSISGSLQTNSLIGVSGTVIVANRPDALFPTALPGSDVSFFVSGSRGGKGAAERTVSLFGGDAVISGSLTIGTGSVTITSNDVQFGSFANRIELNGSNITFFDGNNTSGRTLTSLAAAAAGGNNTEVQYNNGGSLAGSSAFTFDAASGRVTATHLAAGTSLTASLIYTPASSADLYNTGPTTINFGGGASTLLSIGPSGGVTTIAGDLKVGGNDIIASDNQTNITMTSNSLTTFAGDIKVGGNDIQASNGTVALTLDTSGNVTVAGDLTVTGNDIKSSGGNTAITLTAAGNVVIPGDLTVNGTTVTADVATFTVEDPLVGFGFTSGSAAVTAGDRGWIGGISGGDNVAMYWRNGSTEFQAVRTDSTPNATTINRTSYANFAAGVIRAESGLSGSHTKLSDGTSAFIAGSGISISSASNGAVTITSTASTNPGGSDTQIQFNDGGTTFGGDAGLTYNKTTDTLTGVTGSFYRVLVSDVGTVNGAVTLGDASSDTVTINGTTTFAGAAVTTTFQGSGSIAGTLNVTGVTTMGVANINTNLLAAGNVTLGDTSADTVTIGGTTTFFGAGVTTTLQGSGSISGALTVGGNTTLGTSSARTVTVNGVTTFAGSSVTTTLQGSGSISGALLVAGNTTLGATSANTITVNGTTTFAGATVTTTLAGSGSISGNLTVGGSTTLGNGSDDTVTVNGVIGSNLLPSSDRLYNLGSPTARWANVYTGDLHLRNERGNWTVIEEEQYLSIRNNHTGKMYKFVLEEIVDPTEE